MNIAYLLDAIQSSWQQRLCCLRGHWFGADVAPCGPFLFHRLTATLKNGIKSLEIIKRKSSFARLHMSRSMQ
jgi:type IV secretory pathway VirJ component